ncbi:MAG: shikimate kinase [Eubacteriales bacterium]|nr:shikimate kinase [Eubacteriales bacterium]
MENVILIGFMGAGKTTVGKLLAKELQMSFLDTDERIEVEQGRSIPEIFATDGEQCFRDLETELLKKMQEDTKNSVISVGGGLPVREENRELLRKLGTVIYLSASKETILSRVKNDGTRPMLNSDDLEARVEKLMHDRERLYKAAAHLDIRTDERSVARVLQIIRQELFKAQ